ncbi:putative integral membrane protein [Babesia bovis T2Bo]|uniref:putative integral membrane protein n=1 Tax=Babesia bovis T2Bo TaxID=484906 RepID=UPI001D6952D3|nr:putative integral membrane protein [Babesia bovis T2Bo]EDO07167.2 putative integral membrane protein [Babesia bovis T2Bo]
MLLNNIFNVKTARIWNSLSRQYHPFQTSKAVASVFNVNDAIARGRRGFCNSKKLQGPLEWSNYREVGRTLVDKQLVDNSYKYDVNAITQLPKPYEQHIDKVVVSKALGFSPLFKYYVDPLSMVKFASKYVLSLRFFFIYMARTTFQAVRPLLAFCVFGEIMKLILANISGGVPAFLFSFVLAFEVLYFFLQCYISYTFLTMFFTVMF